MAAPDPPSSSPSPDSPSGSGDPPPERGQGRAALQEALGDDFEVLQELGDGAMATVYLARERALDRLVAIKVLRPGQAKEETARKRFEREARAAASLSHRSVVSVHRFGRLPDETPYLVMRYVKGRTMEERLKAEGRLSIDEARQVLHDVASALAAAHQHGFLHRDVRSGNVLWDTEEKRALLTDFGITAILATSGEEVTRLTHTGQIVGQPRYMSPEQLNDDDVTELADIYQLGILGYELLTGEGPYDARTNTEWITAHLTSEPRDLRKVRPDVDPVLADLLGRCLAREPKHRPGAMDVVRALGGGETPPGPAKHAGDDLADLIQRRVPQIVGLALVVAMGLMAIADALESYLPPDGVLLTAVFSAAIVVASAVVAWFHGEKGAQRAPLIEYVFLGLIGVAWLGASAWIVLSR